MYRYEEQKPEILTDEGQKVFLKIRDNAKKLLKEAGSFSMLAAMQAASGDSWLLMACVDRLVELGEVREITSSDVPAQYRVFVSNE